MSARARRWALLLGVVLAAALPAASAQAADGDNHATAIATHDGAREFDFAWDIDQEGGGAVDSENVATSRAAGCAGASGLGTCQARAVAFQIVLAWDSRTVVPVNIADAQNIACPGCEASSEAKQFVGVYDTPVRLTRGGRVALGAIKRDLAALESRWDLDPFAFHAAVEQAEGRVRAVLSSEVVEKSDPDQEATAARVRFRQASDTG